METPHVSVMVITYNHAAYIRQAIMSVIEQEVDFSLVINVIDDCSTDGTQEIIRTLKQEYPDKIELFLNAKNIGYKVTQKNFYRGFKTLTGTYMAILEGDDYWSDTGKLQKQIDFLENNPEYVACAHNALKVYEDREKEPHLFLPPPDKACHDIHDLIMISSYFHTTTLTYRNVLKDRVPDQFINPLSCDLFVTMAHAQYGYIRFFSDDVMSVYRDHTNGRFSGMAEVKGWIFNIDGLRQYNKWLGYKYRDTFNASIYRYCTHLLSNGTREGGLTFFKWLKYRAIMRYYRYLSKNPHKSYHSPSALIRLLKP
ncbi:glycosyltransferase family 2 protein [Roseobacter sp. EG26]|uniref:glycosyltransferase family 2 protein n=1 Tax=Roseobacter sp. EG26 TaxID=3412477 RepID=UPI003CE494C7